MTSQTAVVGYEGRLRTRSPDSVVQSKLPTVTPATTKWIFLSNPMEQLKEDTIFPPKNEQKSSIDSMASMIQSGF